MAQRVRRTRANTIRFDVFTLSEVPLPVRAITREQFLDRAWVVHGEAYDYSRVGEDDLASALSILTIRCNRCHYESTPTLVDHLTDRSGCPRCRHRDTLASETHEGGNTLGKIGRWRNAGLAEFIKRMRIIYGDLIDYSKVTPDHIQTSESQVPIRCRGCGDEWEPTIASLINRGFGCERCQVVDTWDLDRFLKSAILVHGVVFDYSRITPEHFTRGRGSRVEVGCLKCGYRWQPRVIDHITATRGCPACAKAKSKWTVSRFLKKARKTHGYKYDYSQIAEGHITSQNSTLTIRCRGCDTTFSQILGSHLDGFGCPYH